MPETDNMEVEEDTKTQKSFQWPVHKVPDVFFTEAIFQKYSNTPPYIEMLKMYKGPHPDDNTKPQAQNPTKALTGLETPKSGFRFPHYSQLTEGLIKFYLYLNHTYGAQRKRVVSDKDAKEYQQWVNFQKQLAMEQKEFQTFAQQVAMASPEDYAVFIPGSVQNMEKYLEDNKARVLKYPRFYRMNESLSLNADPVLPSDPQLTLSQGPMYQDDIQLLYCNKLGKDSEELLCRGDQIVPNTEKETSRIHQSDLQAEADIVVSIKALETLVDNHHLENHPHQWEIPFTVTTSSQSAESDGITTKVVVLEDPFTCHNYYPYEANHLLANTLLKQHIQRSGKSFAETRTPARGGMQYFRKHFCVKKTDEYAAGLDGDHPALDKKEVSTPVPGVSICDMDQSGDIKDALGGENKGTEECRETDPPDKEMSERTDVTNFAADEKNVRLGLDEENVRSREVETRDSPQDVDMMQTSQAKSLDEKVSADNSSKSKNVADFIGKDPSVLDSDSNLEKVEECRKSAEEEDQVSPGRRMTRGLAKQMENSGESVSKSEVSESPTRVKSEASSPESVNRRVTRSASKRSQGEEGGPSAKRVTRSTAALTTAVEKEVTVNVKLRSRRKLNVCEENDDKMLESEEKSPKSGEVEMSDKGFRRGDGDTNSDEKLVAGSSTESEIPNVDKLETDENTACIIGNSESSDDELKIDLKEDNLDEMSSRTNSEKVANKTDLGGNQSAPKTRLRKRNVPLSKEGLKGKKVEEKEAAKPSTVPLLDNILQLQRTYLAKKKSDQEVKSDLKNVSKKKSDQEVKTDSKKESESSSSSSLLMDNILHDQTTMLTKMGTVASPPPLEDSMKKKMDGKGKNILKERRADTSIWKIGQLKMCVVGGVDGLYWDYNERRIFPATVCAKMENQPWLGFEQVSMGEASRLWLRAAVFPQSKVIRGRIHCHSSNIMKWEVLGLNNLVTGSQFQPAYTTKVLHNIFTKLLTLDDGSYLLVHHAGDKQAFIYSTVEEEKAQRFIIYDLHAKHMDAKIHHTPPPVVPWAPLDPSLLLPGSFNSLPCIFPPSPYVDQKEYYKVRRFSPMAGVPRQKKKKKKKNKGKKNAANKEEG